MQQKMWHCKWQKLQAVQLQQMKKERERIILYNSKALFEQLYDVMIVYLLGFFNLPKLNGFVLGIKE